MGYVLQVSIVDQRPEELIAAAALGVQVQYAAGLGPSGNASSLRFSVDSIQIDDDIPGTRSDPSLILAWPDEEQLQNPGLSAKQLSRTKS